MCGRHAWRLVLAMLAGLVLLAGGVGSAGATTARRITAPVIKESFTPLRCTHAGTTLSEEGCAEQAILAGDRRIDRLNAEIFQKLGPAGRKDFVAGHDAWLAYRTAYCASESDVYRGGTEAAVVAARCAAGVNAAHVKDLRGFLGDLSQS